MAENVIKETIDNMNAEEVQELISAIDNDILQNNTQHNDYWKIYAGLLQHKIWAYQRLLALKT